MYDVCYVFRAVRCWLISPRWCRRARRDVWAVYSKLYDVCCVFRAVRCLLISPRWCRRARRDVYTVSCMLCVMFSGGFVSADFASLMRESKERCIYSKLYAVCYVFRAVRCLLISPRWCRRARRDVYTVSCMMCVMFSGWFVAGWFRLTDAGEQGEMYIQ